jgi:hypothetical protein
LELYTNPAAFFLPRSFRSRFRFQAPSSSSRNAIGRTAHFIADADARQKICGNGTMTSRRKTFRAYAHPGDLPGHAWAGPAPMRKAGGRPIMTWKNAPFELTAAPGTRARLAQRAQAHRDRLHVLKAHHALAREELARRRGLVATARDDLADAERGLASVRRELTKIEKEIDKMSRHLDRNSRRVATGPRAVSAVSAGRASGASAAQGSRSPAR